MRIARTLARIAVTTATPAAALAQTHATDRGSILVGGQAGFTSAKSDSDGEDSPRFNSLSLAPRALLFVSPGLALGGQVLFGYSSSDDNSTTALGIGPEVAYYFGGADKTTHPYVTASFQYVRTSDEDDNTQSGRTLSGAAGLLVLITPSVGLDAQAYIRRSTASFSGFASDLEQTAFGLSFGISAFVF